MFKRILVSQAVALALAMPTVASAEFSVSGYLRNTTGVFVEDGTQDGATVYYEKQSVDDGVATGIDNAHEAGDLYRFENSVRLFVNADIGNSGASWHGEFNFIEDTEAVSNRLKGYEPYSEYDYFREFYFDVPAGDWFFRLGKQQVVWGTADGIKLLDVINPTDYRFFFQDPFEEARIPVWMANIEKNFANGGNVQFIVSESRENFIPGLVYDDDDQGDSGDPFIFKGVDTMTGKVNGFMNIVPGMGGAAATFSNGAANDGAGNIANPLGLLAFAPAPNGGPTVQNFVDDTTGVAAFQGACQALTGVAATSAGCLNQFVNAQPIFEGTPNESPNPYSNEYVTDLLDTNRDVPTDSNYWFTNNGSDPNSAFEYFNDARFATFDSFVSAKTRWDTEDTRNEPNLGFRYRNTTGGGTNWSVNYLYAYDPNPVVSISWEDAQGNPVQAVNIGNNVLQLQDANGNAACSFSDSLAAAAASTNTVNEAFAIQDQRACTLVFNQTLERSHYLGASFDTAIDRAPMPLVIRGEFLYQKDAHVPVIDRNKLAIGDLAGGLYPEKTDIFKYVLGFDFTFFRNLLVSPQLIQFYDLDFIDEQSGCGNNPNCGRYTGDAPTLNTSNNLNKGDQLQTFISLFFSKPFGAEQQHRWNDIIIAHSQGGYWNRFDVEYQFHDNLIGSAALNYYWGDEDSLFGQLQPSSNAQVSIKWLFQ
jgi:hypothetical protein